MSRWDDEYSDYQEEYKPFSYEASSDTCSLGEVSHFDEGMNSEQYSVAHRKVMEVAKDAGQKYVIHTVNGRNRKEISELVANGWRVLARYQGNDYPRMAILGKEVPQPRRKAKRGSTSRNR